MKKYLLSFTFIFFMLFIVACGNRSVTVSFDAQGGSAVEAITITQLTEITEPVPVREGYSFRGWYEESTFETQFDFTEGATRNITLYAKWETNQYTLSFETNNGTSIADITANYQATITLPSSLNKEGYTFGGWYSDSSFETPFQATRMVASDMTLYAKWNPIFYQVEFYSDNNLVTTLSVQHGATIDQLPAIPQREGFNASWDYDGSEILENGRVDAIYEIKVYTVSFIDQWDHVYFTYQVNHGDLVPEITTNPEKIGYTFAGYSENLAELEITEDIEIEVFFTPISFIVNFRVQGSQVKSETVLYGQSATAPAVNVPGYTFETWDISFDNVTSNLEVNAILIPNDYDITLYGNGGLFGENETDIITQPYQSSVTHTDIPVREGYQFSGWYLNPEGTGSPISLTNYSMPLYGIDLYAKWEAISYTITYHDLFGTQNGNPTTYKITDSFVLLNPTSRTGYNFIGWFDGAEVENQVTEIQLGTTGNLDLYARWEPKEYTITFNSSGGDLVAPLSVLFDEEFILPATVKTGYTFIEWQLDGVTFNSGTWTLTNNITLVAVFEANEYTITFDTNGGDAILPLTVTYDQLFTLPNASKTNYTFIEWQLDSNAFTSGTWNLTEDITLVAKYEAISYSITYYNLNGTTQSNPTSYTVETPTIILQDPTIRTGYTFIGWFTQSTGGTEVTEITLGSVGNKSIYARWLANEYTVTFDTNGGSAILPLTVTYDQLFTLPNASKTGYTFIEWQLDSNTFTSGTWNIPNDITLVAVYEAKDYTITFDTDGGEEILPLTVTYDQAFTLPIPVKTGYSFIEWLNEGVSFDSGTWTLTENTTLVAVFEANEYTITFDANGGDAILPLTVTYDQTFTLPTPVKTGYTFIEWKLEGVGFFSGTWTLTENITVVASYNLNVYSLSYLNLNGTTHSNPLFYTIENPTITLLDPTPRTGYTFVGWFNQASGGTEVSEITLGSIGNKILYARWLANEYTISFDSTGGAVIADMTVTYGQSFNLPVPTQTGYNFAGWTYNLEAFGSGVYNIADNITLVATWTEWPVIYFESNGGSPVTNETEAPGTVITEPTSPTRPGYTFLGWYLDDGTFLNEYTFSVMPSESLILYARWEPKEYTITFNSNGGDLVDPLSVLFDEEFILPVTVKTGYTFIEWQLDGVMFESGTWTLTEDITLVAAFEANEYTLTFDTNGGDAILPLTVTYDQAFTLPTPVKTGYTFIEWQLEGVGFISGTWTLTENITVVASYNPNVYSLSYLNLNGTTHSNPVNYTIETPTITLLDPTIRTGYTFIGWFTQSTGGTEVTEITLGSVGNKILYARWLANEYTVTFDTDGGEEILPLTVTYDQAFTLPIPVKTGYTFIEWQLNSNTFTSGTWIIPNDITLVAVYEAKEYTITFDTDGGEEILPLSVTYDQAFTLPIPVKTGYSFIEWLIEGVSFDSGTWTLTNDITLVAVFAADTYSITYLNLEGTTHSNPTGYSIETPTINLTNPSTRNGYNFVGWFTELTGGTQVTSIPVGSTEDKILYARWEAITYTITFDIDGVETYVYVPYMENIQLVDIPAIPTKVNYDLTTPYWDTDPTTHVVTGNFTFTAIYVGNPMTVTYNTGEGSTIDPDTVAYGLTLATPTPPTRNGNTFLAWYIDSELTTLYDFNDPVVASITLYAAWQLDFYTWEIESIFLKEDLNDPNIVILDPTQPAITTSFINLYYGIERNPVQMYEGYVFDYFVYDGVEYSDIEQLIMVTGDRTGLDKIQVYYRKIILTITFAQDPDLFDTIPEDPIVTFKIYYNDTFLLANAPALAAPELTGYSVFWDRTEFSNMRESIVVYAIYYNTGVKTVTFLDRGVIKFITSQVGEIIEVIGSESILWDLYRPGYKFLGWFDEETGGNQIIQGDLLFSQFGEGMTNLYAQWLELTPFTTPTNIAITADDTQIVISWDINPATINGLQPAGYEFVLNNQLITGLTTVPTLSVNTYTLTLLSTNPEYALFQELVNPGTHNLTIRALGDEDNHYHSEVSEVFEFINESIFSGDPTEVAVYDYFIIETFEDTKRYIFYTNLDYQFGLGYTFEIVTGQEFATANANTISTNGISGSFKFRMIRDGYPTVVYDALVVHDIKQFDIGSNYQNYLDAKEIGSAFLDQAVDYYVGYANEFYLDLRMVNNQGSRIPLAQTYLDYELYELVGETYQLIPEASVSSYLSFVGDNQIQLQASTVGKTLKLVVEPRYQANAMVVTPLEYVFTVNDGVNVFNNQQLKQYFADFNVSTINIHASFKAELSTEQKNSDGSPINRRPTLANPITGNAYQRYSTSIDDDQFTIEGNFMTIDGSELPFSNADSGSGTVGFAQSFEIINVQIGVFFYGVTDTSLTNNLNNNRFTMNNLIVKGNTSTPYVDFSGTAEEIEIQERLMSRNSGGYTGVMVASGSSNLNNLIIFNTVIAVTNNAFGYKTDTMPTYITMDYVKVYNSWANSLYSHGGLGFLLYNSEIGQSGGAAIHMVDSKPAIFDEFYNEIGDPNPYLYLDSTTDVNNWVSGEEAWFKAYGMSQVALTLKSGIETGIAPTERSIINLMTDPVTGLETEKINFILLTEPYSTAKVMLPPNNIEQISGSEVKVHIGDYQVERSFDYLTSGDPRISGGQFAFPLGDYSEYADFYALIVELMSAPHYLPQAQAESLAQMAAFYGLTAQETVTVASQLENYGDSFRAAVEGIYPTYEFPEYIEILAPVPVFTSGYSIVIIQFSE